MRAWVVVHAPGKTPLAGERRLQVALFRLTARLGLPTSLGQLGVDRAAIERAAPRAERDPANRTNPRRARREDYLALMQGAL